MLSIMSVMSLHPALCKLSVRTVVKLCTFVCFSFRGDLGFLNCNGICMCVVNKLLAFVFYSVYVDLKYNEIPLIFTAGMYACVVCVAMWSSLFCL